KIVDVLVHWGARTMSVMGLNRDLPFANITAIDVIFSDDVLVTGSEASLASTLVGGGKYTFSNASYDTARHAETWTLPSAIGIDRLMLSLDETIAAAVDRSITISGKQSFKFAVLPGDFDGDGVVTSADLAGVRNQMPAYLAPGATSQVWGDLDGNGLYDTTDY